MNATLEAVRDKPVGLFRMDDTAPFQDYSGYNRTGTIVSGTPTTSIALHAGAVYSTNLNRSIVAKFDSPVFQQGQEDKPFSLESWLYSIKKTTGNTPQTYRENLFPTPSFETSTSFIINGGGNTGTGSTTQKITGSQSLRIVPANENWGYWPAHTVIRPDTTVTFSVYVYSDAAQSLVLRNYGTNTVDGPTVSVPANAWTRLTLTQSFGSTIGNVFISVRRPGAIGMATPFYMDAFLLEETPTVGTYFDGSLLGYEWAGTAHASTSRTRVDVNRINLAHRNNLSSLGSGPARADGISWNGGTWSRKSYDSAIGGQNPILRQYVNLSDLVSGQTYTVTATLGNDGASSITIFYDWTDLNTKSVVIPAGSMVTVTQTFSRAIYDSVFRFADFELPSSGAGSFLIKDIIIEPGAVSHGFFNGSTPGAEWTGSVDASTSIMYISDGEQQILGNTGKYDGLTIDGTKVAFTTKYLTTGECRAEYDLQVRRRACVVGVHTAENNFLYVDGELVANTEVTEEQQADQFVVTDTFLYSGQSLSSQGLCVNGIGIYASSLSAEQVARHFAVGNSHRDRDSVAISYGGVRIPFTQNEADVFLEQSWYTEDDWSEGYGTDVVVEDSQLKPRFAVGISLAGTWYESFPLAATDATSVYGVNMMWDGEGVIIEASLDGVTWETVERGKNINLIPVGFNPTDKELEIRASFTGGVEDDPAYLDSLTVVGYETGVTPEIAGRVVTYTAPAYVKNDYEPIELSDDWGVALPTGKAVLSADTSADPLLPKTIEIWLKRNDGGAFYIDGRNDGTEATSPILQIASPTGNNTTRGTTYMNGSTLFSATPVPVGEWVVLHIVSSDPNYLLGQLYLNRAQWGVTIGQTTADIQIGQVVLYEDAKTAAQIAEIYAAYMGLPKVQTIDTATIAVTEPATAATVYDYDWSISAS